MLLRLTGKSLVQRPLRYVLTGAAIVFSVAAVVAVFIFTDGLRATFNELATNIESGYDIAVQPTVGFGGGTFLPTVPLDQLDIVTAQPGVLAAQPRVVGVGVVAIDGMGEPTIAPAGPNLGVLWGDRLPETRYFVQEGRRPSGDTEFALDIDAFSDGDYQLGEDYTVQVPAAIESGTTFTLVGTFTFADPDRNALVGARLVAFDENAAVELINAGEGYSDITIALEPDADQAQVTASLVEVLNDDLQVRSQEEILAETQGSFGEVLDIFQRVLLAFAFIILIVSAFLIYNVFTITLGQRIRELGLLRAVGALGSQITQLMLGEALLLGVISTLVGIPAGLGLAWILRAALILLGFPDNTGLPVSQVAIYAACFVGIGVTMAAAVWPSIQARRVSPMSALRDGANISDLNAIQSKTTGLVLVLVALAPFRFALQAGWIPRLILPIVATALVYFGVNLFARSVGRLIVLPIGVTLLVITVVTEAETLGETFALLGAGAFITLWGAILLSPHLVRPATTLLGHAPTAVAIGIVGMALGASAVAAVAFAVIIGVQGVPAFIIDAIGQDIAAVALIAPLIIGAVVFSILSYALVRTAFGARGLSGKLARANAARNPQRTATTAAALMIGLTLVTAVTVIGDSIKTSISGALSSSITADWLLRNPTAGPTPIPFSSTAADRLRALDEVDSVVSFRVAFPAAWVTSDSGELRASDFQEFLPIVLELLDADELDPQRILELRDELGTDVQINDAAAVSFADLDDHIDPDWVERDETLAQQPNAIFVADQVAEDQGLEVGDTFSALFIDLQSEDLVVAGIYENAFVLGNRVMTLEMWERHFPTDSDQFLTVRTTSGVTPEVARAALNAELNDDFPTIDVQDRAEFAEAQERQINQTLATVNVLLGLSAVIAALGILLTLALSVFERTREIGLFRAVGSTTQQTRWIIRWEGVIVAAFGGLGGVVLGVAFGVIATSKMPEILVTEVSVPIPTLAIYVLVSAITGLAAAAFPAWLAGRMNVLDAISSE